jgi:hypothetical protein
VQVALDAAPCLVGGPDDSGPGGGQLGAGLGVGDGGGDQLGEVSDALGFSPPRPLVSGTAASRPVAPMGCAARGRGARAPAVRPAAGHRRAGAAGGRNGQQICRRAVDPGAHRAGDLAADRCAPPSRPRVGDPVVPAGLERPATPPGRQRTRPGRHRPVGRRTLATDHGIWGFLGEPDTVAQADGTGPGKGRVTAGRLHGLVGHCGQSNRQRVQIDLLVWWALWGGVTSPGRRMAAGSPPARSPHPPGPAAHGPPHHAWTDAS